MLVPAWARQLGVEDNGAAEELTAVTGLDPELSHDAAVRGVAWRKRSKFR